MTVLQALILSVVEGVTEFLPVSSTGHLILASSILGIQPTDFVKSFEIAIQSGAITAVILRYFQRVIKNPTLIKPVAYAFVPTAIIGMFLYKFIKNVLLGSTMVTVLALLIGGVIIICIENLHGALGRNIQKGKSLSAGQALLIGVIQALSVIPGVSRAAATIIGGMVTGLSRESAVEFSFLLAVPTILAATGLDLIKSGQSFTPPEYTLMGIGFIGALLSAAVTIRFFVSFVERHTLSIFGYYRIIVAILFLVWANTFTLSV